MSINFSLKFQKIKASPAAQNQVRKNRVVLKPKWIFPCLKIYRKRVVPADCKPLLAHFISSPSAYRAKTHSYLSAQRKANPMRRSGLKPATEHKSRQVYKTKPLRHLFFLPFFALKVRPNFALLPQKSCFLRHFRFEDGVLLVQAVHLC